MILDAFRLSDRVALVTGSGRGIGRAIAVAFAEAGADVVCSARTASEIEETAAQVRAHGRRALALAGDVMDAAFLERLVAAALEAFGRIDVLVNNAGGALPRAALALSERAFEKIVRFNLTSPFLLTKAVVPRMVETAGGGAVVNISSGASTLAIGGMAAYGSAKAGLNQLTRILATEFAPKVRVNAIVVGQIDTPGASSVLSDEMKREAAARIPLKRIGQDSDIAACALYLASPAAAWVTGHAIAVDGGVGAGSVPTAFPIPPL